MKYILIVLALLIAGCASFEIAESPINLVKVEAGVPTDYIIFNKRDFKRVKGKNQAKISSFFISEVGRSMGAKEIKELDVINGYLFKNATAKMDAMSLPIGDDWVIQPNYRYSIVKTLYDLVPVNVPDNPSTCPTCPAPVCPGPIDPGPGPGPQPGVSPCQGQPGWNLARTGACQARAKVDASKVLVCDTDTGIDANHPEFVGRLKTPGVSRIAGEAWNTDGSGHGTHTAGTIAGIRYGGSNATIYPLKGLSRTGSGTSESLAQVVEDCIAVQWPGKKVLSASWGMDRGTDQMIGQAVDRAVAAGIIVVFAAGNSSGAIGFPGSKANVKTATAMDQNDRIASFSSRGVKAGGEMWIAPGVNIQSAKPGGGEATMSGTSMACPLLAAAWANALAMGRNTIAADNIGLSMSEQGKGLVNMLSTVQ